MIVVFTAEAEADLEAIGDYIELDNPLRAVTFIAELRQRCLGIAEMPRAYPLLPRHEERGIRRRVHGRYLILYREEPGRILILHILHDAMDHDAMI